MRKYSIRKIYSYLKYFHIYQKKNSKTKGWDGWIHTVFLNNLTSSSTYFYQVGSNAGWSDEYSFSVAPSTPEGNLNFATFGDMGTSRFLSKS